MIKYAIYCDMDGVLCDFYKSIIQRMNYALQNIDLLPNVRLQHYALKALNDVQRNYAILTDIHSNTFHNESTFHLISKPMVDLMFRLIDGDKLFWDLLPWTTDGIILWHYIGYYNPTLLTCPHDVASIEGKKMWTNRELGNIPIIFERSKFVYSKKNAILIDDSESNINSWNKYKGIGILYKNAQQTIQQLKLYLS